MSWANLPTFTKSSGTAMVTASLRKDRHGEVKLTLYLSTFISDKFGDAEAINVQVGSGPNAGLVRLVGDADGVHKLGKGIRGAKRLSVPWFEGIPKDSAEGAKCGIVSESAGDVVIRLPVAEWEVAIGRRLPKSGFAAPVPKPPVAQKQTGGGKLDVAAYLQTRGIKISRLAPGRFAMDGETVMLAEVLKVVNRHRERMDLKELKLDEVE